jgi:hypothetical protein
MFYLVGLVCNGGRRFTRMNPPPGSSRVFEIGSEFFQMPAGFLSDKSRAGFGLIARAGRPVHAGGFSMMEEDWALRDANSLAAPIALKKN